MHLVVGEYYIIMIYFNVEKNEVFKTCTVEKLTVKDPYTDAHIFT